MLVFKYRLRVFKYLTTVYNNHPVKKICIFINYILDLHDIEELPEDQRHISITF